MRSKELHPIHSWIVFAVFSIHFSLCSAGADFGAPWIVFHPAGGDLPMGPELLSNPGFESGPPGAADSWRPYVSGLGIDETGGRGGGRALLIENPVETESHGAYQRIILGQAERKALHFSAWSRAEGVTGGANPDYSFYLDLFYRDGTPLYGQILTFKAGSHDWEFREGFILPEKPISEIYAHCLLRRTHSGRAWFDDLSIREVNSEITTFDRVAVAFDPPLEPPYGGPSLRIATADGLSIGLSAEGGAVTEVAFDGAAANDPRMAFAGGFFLRDAASSSFFIHAGGAVSWAGDALEQTASVPDLGLDLSATYRASADSIAIRAEIQDRTGRERAIALYFALPLLAEGWTWGDDIRRERPATGLREIENTFQSWYGEIGSNGFLSSYPWACLARQEGGIAFGNPLSSPRIFRFACHPVTGQLYVAYDLGLSPLTSGSPGGASIEFILYRFDSRDGFRGAAQGYYDRFPEAFIRRIPPEEEGIWVAFSPLAQIPGIQDFGIAFHELGGVKSQVPFDDGAGIRSFRYVSEPWSHWLPVDDPAVDPEDYGQVMAYLRNLREKGDAASEATLSSGFFTDDGRYVYRSTVAPWCRGTAGCAVFTVNPDPDIADPLYPLNKGNLDWNDGTMGTYLQVPGLDGEYVDSFLAQATVLDFRASHFAAAGTPLSFRTTDGRPGVPMVFAVTEFARRLAEDVHERLGKLTMANGMLLMIPWGADLFDVMGTETDWLSTGSFEPLDDRYLSYFRTLSFQKPYCFLMNTNFDLLTPDLVERYFQVCLFYGIYPSMFSHNAAEDTYWENPGLVERDRELFKAYIPLIRRLNTAGWRPVTEGTTSNPDVYIERFGAWPDLHFTLRNVTEAPAQVEVMVDARRLGIPEVPIAAATLLGKEVLPLSDPLPLRTVSLTLGPYSSEILFLLVDPARAGQQVPGDANQDRNLDISDVLLVLFHLFTGEVPALPCEGKTAANPGEGELALLDSNGDGAIDLSDPLGTLGWLFLGRSAHILGEECRPIAGCPEICGPR